MGDQSPDSPSGGVAAQDEVQGSIADRTTHLSTVLVSAFRAGLKADELNRDRLIKRYKFPREFLEEVIADAERSATPAKGEATVTVEEVDVSAHLHGLVPGAQGARGPAVSQAATDPSEEGRGPLAWLGQHSRGLALTLLLAAVVALGVVAAEGML